MDFEHAKRVGIEAIYSGARVLRDHFGHISQINQKSAFDLVTEADTESEKQIIETIRKTFPDHAILAEESGANKGTAEFQWLIDPLDGTTNYVHQLPFYSIAIALAVHDEIVLGLVLNPMDGELF